MLEELDDYIETHCRKNGIDVIGKEAFTLQGEYSQSLIAKVILDKETSSLETDLADTLVKDAEQRREEAAENETVE